MLIGRNREWGRMYAARFQMGTGNALRTALAAGRAAEAARAFGGIEAGFSTIEPSGRLPASVPLSISLGATPSETDVASGAAFFLGDACLGLLALEASPLAGQVAPAARRERARALAARAITWLASAAPLLAAGDADAPNRLLFDARAFLACGRLASDSAVVALAPSFVATAIASLSPEGWFDEGGGWDTGYQGVALDIGLDVHAVLGPGPSRDSLDDVIARGARWLAGRVTDDGRVDSVGNRRTCDGGESFLGEPKRLALTSVIAGLARASVLVDGDPGDAGDAARRVIAWAIANPGIDPCYVTAAP